MGLFHTLSTWGVFIFIVLLGAYFWDTQDWLSTRNTVISAIVIIALPLRTFLAKFLAKNDNFDHQLSNFNHHAQIVELEQARMGAIRMEEGLRDSTDPSAQVRVSEAENTVQTVVKQEGRFLNDEIRGMLQLAAQVMKHPEKVREEDIDREAAALKDVEADIKNYAIDDPRHPHYQELAKIQQAEIAIQEAKTRRQANFKGVMDNEFHHFAQQASDADTLQKINVVIQSIKIHISADGPLKQEKKLWDEHMIRLMILLGDLEEKKKELERRQSQVVAVESKKKIGSSMPSPNPSYDTDVSEGFELNEKTMEEQKGFGIFKKPKPTSDPYNTDASIISSIFSRNEGTMKKQARTNKTEADVSVANSLFDKSGSQTNPASDLIAQNQAEIDQLKQQILDYGKIMRMAKTKDERKKAEEAAVRIQRARTRIEQLQQNILRLQRTAK